MKGTPRKSDGEVSRKFCPWNLPLPPNANLKQKNNPIQAYILGEKHKIRIKNYMFLASNRIIYYNEKRIVLRTNKALGIFLMFVLSFSSLN